MMTTSQHQPPSQSLMTWRGPTPYSHDDVALALTVHADVAGEMDRMMSRPLDEHALGLMRVLCEHTAHTEAERTAHSSDGKQQPAEGGAVLDGGVAAGRGGGVAAAAAAVERECGAGVSTYEEFAPWLERKWGEWVARGQRKATM